jgi:hypothetical protein
MKRENDSSKMDQVNRRKTKMNGDNGFNGNALDSLNEELGVAV